MSPEAMNAIVVVSTGASAIAAGAIAYFSYTTMKVSRQLAWFTGAMESHSQLQLMLEAKRHGDDVQMIWWDPTLQVVPTAHKHGEPVQVSPIYVFVPRRERAGPEKIKR